MDCILQLPNCPSARNPEGSFRTESLDTQIPFCLILLTLGPFCGVFVFLGTCTIQKRVFWVPDTYFLVPQTWPELGQRRTRLLITTILSLCQTLLFISYMVWVCHLYVCRHFGGSHVLIGRRTNYNIPHVWLGGLMRQKRSWHILGLKNCFIPPPKTSASYHTIFFICHGLHPCSNWRSGGLCETESCICR